MNIPKFTFKDITMYFTSNCCNSGQSSVETNEFGEPLVETPCQNSAQITAALKDYFIHSLEFTKNYAHATTITIGNKRYGSLSARKQYRAMVKAIKAHIRYHGDQKYLYVFELTKAGVVHAHGLECGTSQQQFIESFSCFGRRNSHNESFQAVKHVKDYLTYMDKEHAFPYITNVMKKDMKEERRNRAKRREAHIDFSRRALDTVLAEHGEKHTS